MHIANDVYSRSNSNSRENHPPSSSLRGKSGFTGMFDLARPIEPSLVAVRLKFTSLNRGRLSPVYAVYVDGRPVGFTPYGCVSALVLDEGLHSVCVGIDRWISDVVAPVPDGPADSGVHRHGRRMSCHFCLLPRRPSVLLFVIAAANGLAIGFLLVIQTWFVLWLRKRRRASRSASDGW
jgi:hypothetical protein